MPYAVALLVIWAVPAGGWLLLASGVETWVEEGWLAVVLGSLVALVLSVIVLPAIALGQAATTLDRRRARRAPADRPGRTPR